VKVREENMIRTRLLAALVALSAIAITPVAARSFNLAKMLGNPQPDAALGTFKLIHVNDLAQTMAKPGNKIAIYDANPADTREAYGVIPGAHLLSSADDYDVGRELPSDKSAKLVFYCANTH
jgi:hypothetical protein